MPGPGTYPSKTIIGTETQGKTLGARFRRKHEEPGANEVPGPGTYRFDANPIKKKQPEYRIGTARRDDMENVMRRTCDFPPANTYNPDYKTIKNRESSWGFGSSTRNELTKSTCGPSMQAYNIPSKAIEGMKQVMGSRYRNGGAL